jgi:GTP-sensing pleiotropic transcriptional regulator CodY
MNGINILQTELEYKKRWVRINKIVKTIKKSHKEELFIVNSKTRTLYFELIDLIKTDISYQILEK